MPLLHCQKPQLVVISRISGPAARLSKELELAAPPRQRSDPPGLWSDCLSPSSDSPLNLAVARNLRRLREMRGLSQERFADTVGFHRTYVSAIEGGGKNLSLRTVERLAERLGVDVLELFRE